MSLPFYSVTEYSASCYEEISDSYFVILEIVIKKYIYDTCVVCFIYIHIMYI